MRTVIKTVNVGVRFPPETLEKLDKFKGYYSRNRFLVKLVDEGLARQENEMKSMTVLAAASGERQHRK